MDRVHVILPVHGRREVTERFVTCLAQQTYPAVQLLLIDDGSRDSTAEAVLDLIPTAEVIRGDGTLWWAGSLQKAAQRLTEKGTPEDDIVLLANDDTTFHAYFIERAVAYLQGKHGVMLLARTKNPQTGRVEESGVHADLRSLRFAVAAKPESINCLSTRGLFLRWKDMRAVGGFFPRLLPHYLSDYEFTLRGIRKGLQPITVDSVWLLPDFSTTGIRSLDGRVGWDFVRTLFSKKCAMNPMYSTSFVLLAVPPRWIPSNILRVWLRALKQLVKQGLLRRDPGVQR